jgi:tol-pal system-associated acyl-CoA thioesterase
VQKISEFIFPIHVNVEDTDYAGVVYYPNYLKFMERARSMWLLQLNLGLHQLAKENIMFVVSHVEVDYIAPARLNDELEVISRIENFGRTSMTFMQEIRKKQQQAIICRGKTDIVCINEKLKPRELPKEVVERIS